MRLLLFVGAMAMFLLGEVRAAGEKGAWGASDPSRKGISGVPKASEGASRTAITIEAGDRDNPFLVPGTHEELVVSKKGKSGKPISSGKGFSAKEVRPVLDDYSKKIAKAEQAFEQGRFSEVPVKDLSGWPAVLEKLPAEKPEDVELKKQLLERAKELAAKIVAREAFLARGYAVQFVVVHEGAPERSVASIGGKIVRTGDSFDDGVVAKTIRKDGVVLAYKGLTFALPLLRMER